MPANYYTTATKYPGVFLAIVERIKYHVCTLLYPTEDYTTVSGKRFIMSNFEAGNEVAIRKSIETFKTSQGNFPFTAYNIGEITPVPEKRSHRQKSFIYYSSQFTSYVSAQPSSLEFLMMSFFNTPNDYLRAKTILETDASSLVRLTVPITVNGTLDSFTVDLEWEITKGDLAFAFEDYLRLGNIYNISHTAKVYFHNLVLNTSISPVDDIQLGLLQLSDIDRSLSTSIYSGLIPPDPTVTSSAPAEGETNVDRDNPIVINFSVAMNEESVESYISSDPFISADFSWNSSGTILAITPTTMMSSGTLYEITIAKEAESANEKPFEEDFTLTFTTGTT